MSKEIDDPQDLMGSSPIELEYATQYDLEQEIDVNFQFKESIQSELDEVLEDLGESDDRKIDVTQLNKELVETIFHNLKHDSNFLKIAGFSIDEWIWAMFNQDELKSLFDHLKDFFDITDDELEDELRQTRFGLEVGRAALQIELYKMEQQLKSSQKKMLEIHRDSQDRKITRQELDILYPKLEVVDEVAEIKEDSFEIITGEDSKPKISQQPLKPIIIQFEILNELELKLRELLKKVFSQYNDWWEKYVPVEVRDKVKKRNRNDPDFSRLQKDQALELIDEFMFSEYQIIITGNKYVNSNAWKLFENIFPHYHYTNNRLVEANILRNRISHHKELSDKEHKQFLHIKEEFVDHINEYLGV